MLMEDNNSTSYVNLCKSVLSKEVISARHISSVQ